MDQTLGQELTEQIMNQPTFNEITISSFEQAKAAFRNKSLKQALYDEGEVVMADVLVNLHADAHRQRRRLENRLFQKPIHEAFEHEFFPPILTATLKPHIQTGRAELVSLSHQLMMNLAATASGIDRPLGTPDETQHLYEHMMRFIEGATLAHYAGDRDAKRDEVSQALRQFDAEFLQPSIERRRALIDGYKKGELQESEVPKDVLTTLLRNEDDLHLPDEVVLRETAFFLLAGAHTSATAFVRTLHNIFTHPALGASNLDLLGVQRCVHETVRLQPSSPTAMRWATDLVELPGGVLLQPGDRLTIDLMSANRDPEIYGTAAEQFDPTRTLLPGAPPWGLSFGMGMHACIGQDLAAGHDNTDVAPAESDDRLFGLVPHAVLAVLEVGGRPDPVAPAELDPLSARGYWSKYPIIFGMP